MECDNCRHRNESTSEFCGECTPLVARCPSCDAEHPPTLEFCTECGTSMRSALGVDRLVRHRPVTRRTQRARSALGRRGRDPEIVERRCGIDVRSTPVPPTTFAI